MAGLMVAAGLVFRAGSARTQRRYLARRRRRAADAAALRS